MKQEVKMATNEQKFKEFSNRVIEIMNLDKVPATPEYYKIYFQKLLLDEKDSEFRKYIAKLNIRENNSNETERILSYEAKFEQISNLSKNMLKNIQETYKKNGYLVEFIEKNKTQSKSLTSPKAVEIFLKKLSKTITNIQNLLKKDLFTIRKLYNENISILRELENKKIFHTDFKIYKKDYFLEKLKCELENTQEMNIQSYLMLIKLDKQTIKLLNSPMNIEKAHRFFSKILTHKLKENIIGYLENGVFGVIFSNLNSLEIQKLVLKFTDILNQGSIYLDDDYIELHSVFAVREINGDCHIKIITDCLDLVDKTFEDEKPYLISE